MSEEVPQFTPVTAYGIASTLVEANYDQNNWDVELISFPTNKKVALLGYMKNTLGWSLNDGMQKVKTTPSIIEKYLQYQKAQKLANDLRALGAEIELASSS